MIQRMNTKDQNCYLKYKMVLILQNEAENTTISGAWLKIIIRIELKIKAYNFECYQKIIDFYFKSTGRIGVF